MNRKHWLLLSMLIALAALAALASSLHDVQFQPGHPIAVQASTSSPLIQSPPDSIMEIPLWKILLFWAAFLVSVLLLIYLMPPDLRKRLLKQILSFAITILAFFIALRYRIIQLPQFVSGPPAESTQVAMGLDSNSPLPAFQPPVMVPWMMFFISFVVLLALLFLARLGFRAWRRYRAQQSAHLNDLAEIARSSLDDLAAGRDWSDVIIQSYMRMSAVVGEKRGLNRAVAMTPREFAARLEFAGLPAEAVQRLTRLFESVRYGARPSDQADIHEAVACLNSILQACGAAA